MEITGRITADARVHKTKDNKEVVSFTIVDNDFYKTKNGEKVTIAEYFKCSYWQSPKVAPILKKGCIVTISGSLHANSYKDKNGNYKASLECNVQRVKIIDWGKKDGTTVSISGTSLPISHANTDVLAVATNDDLPF